MTTPPPPERQSEAQDGGPAFPVHGGYLGDDPRNQILGGGLTIRDWFAGQALAGMSASADWYDKPWGRIADEAYVAADALLSARGETK